MHSGDMLYRHVYHDFDDLDTRALGARAVEKALRSQSPRAVEPGRWTVVMEPTTVGNMVNLMKRKTGSTWLSV